MNHGAHQPAPQRVQFPVCDTAVIRGKTISFTARTFFLATHSLPQNLTMQVVFYSVVAGLAMRAPPPQMKVSGPLSGPLPPSFALRNLSATAEEPTVWTEHQVRRAGGTLSLGGQHASLDASSHRV